MKTNTRKIIRTITLGMAAMSLALLAGCPASRLSVDNGARVVPGGIESESGRQIRAAGDAIEMSYGGNALQKLDYWRPSSAGSPLVVFVHGGGWMRGDKRNSVGEKSTHFLSQGYGFASLNYRLVPACTVEQQAQDVAVALAFLISRAESLGFDTGRIVLMGHSAGAHLAALVGADMRYLEKAGLGPDSLRGIIALDGACYDVPRQIAQGNRLMRDNYPLVFGNERERQIALSPTHHAAAPNAPAFLILHVQRADGIAQSRAFAEALKKAGTAVETRGFDGRGLKGHAEINRRLGDPSYPATPVVGEWLKHIFTDNKNHPEKHESRL